MSQAYDEKALWQKSRLFLNHAMDSGEPRTFDECALWASLALELLAKAALARISPLLIASPNEEGTNLLIASGLISGDGAFNSVTASTLFSRCAKAFRPFDVVEAKKIARARNEYLHGGAASFCPIPEEAWWPAFWAQAVILVHAQDKEIEDLVGYDRVQIVEQHLARNRRNIEHRIEIRLERARQRLAQVQSGDMPAKRLAEWKGSAILTANLSYSIDQPCPACGANGTLEGEDVDSTDLHQEQIYEDEWITWQEVTVWSDYFSCPTCHLVLDNSELIEAAGLPDSFSAEGEEVHDEPDYGND